MRRKKKLIDILFQFNEMNKPTKRRSDNLDLKESVQNERTDILIKKGPKGEKTIKYIDKEKEVRNDTDVNKDKKLKHQKYLNKKII